MMINSVSALYHALSDADNAGVVLELDPGKYVLSEVTGANSKGIIEFGKDMTIRGKVNDAGKVILDASKLPGTSFNPTGGFPARTGAIRMGNGHNKLEWITVIGSTTDAALSVIDTDLITPNTPSHVEITNCIITQGRIGINVRNVGEPSNGRIVHASIEHNDITGLTVSQPGTQQGQGIVVQHANGVSGGQLHVSLKRNHVHHNIMGMRLFNNSGSQLADTCDNKIMVSSQEDLFDQNKLGMYIQGSSNNTTGTQCERNEVVLDAHKSIIRENRGIIPDPIVLPCGIFLTGGTKPRTGSTTSDNNVIVKLKDCQFSGNQDFDIRAFGAFTATVQPPAEAPLPQPLPGEDNHVVIKLKGQSDNATLWMMNCFPAEPAATNDVDVKVAVNM